MQRHLGFADQCLPKAHEKTYLPHFKYVGPAMYGVEYLKNQVSAALFTCRFDPLRNRGVEYRSKLQEVGAEVYYPNLICRFRK